MVTLGPSLEPETPGSRGLASRDDSRLLGQLSLGRPVDAGKPKAA